METNTKMKIVGEEQFVPMLKAFCSKPQTQPLVIFYLHTFNSYIHQTVGQVADSVFGDGRMKNILLSEGHSQIDMLSELPHKLYGLYTRPLCDGYDAETLYAEKLAKASRKHVVLMIPVINDLITESLYSHKLLYYDDAAKLFLAWKERAQVWVADFKQYYNAKRQVFWGYQSRGVLDMLKEWSEKGKMDDILKAVSDNVYLNEAYTQYVRKTDLPSILKCAEFHEELFTSEEETPYGKILTIELHSLSRGSGKDLDYFFLKNKYRMTTELKLTLPQ